MGRVNRQWWIRNAKRLALGVGLLSLTSALVAGGYLISHYQAPTHATKSVAPTDQPLLDGNHGVELSNSLFRLPLDAQESLFVRMFWGVDAQQGSPERFGLVQYGIGTEAARIEKWLGGQQFGDAEHALWIVDRAGRYKREPILEERLVPVSLTNRSFQVALPSEARPKSAYVMRVRKQVDPSSSEQTQQVEVATFERLPEAGWQISTEALYTRGREGTPSVLQLRSKELANVSAEANWWVVVWFNVEAPRNEQLVIVGVLSGQFVNADGTIRLKAGEAACVRLHHTLTSRKVEYIQPAELRVQRNQCVLRWDAVVTSGYRLLEVKLYAVPSPLPVSANGIEEWSKLQQAALTLDASWYWAPQKPFYSPNF
jgi:hypothetical protein